MLEVKNLTKSFGDFKALDDISFTVKRGTFLAILGSSGSGKSTLLRTIAGLEKPDSGKIFIDGRDVTNESPSKRSLSMVFQSYALFPHLNVKENIIFGLKIRKVKKHIREQKLKQVAELVGLENLLDRKPSQLSGGQKQSVALARAIISGYPLCLMDEPLSNLDAKLRHEMRVGIKRLQEKLGLTIVYVTHDQTEAMSMGDNIILINGGKIKQQGTPYSFYQRPETVSVARFIGTPPMNILKVFKKNGKAYIDNKPLRISNLDNLPDGKYLLGIRPEDSWVCNNQDGIDGTVLYQDYYGQNSILGIKLCQSSKEPFLLQINGDNQYKVNERIKISFNEKKLHVFDINGKRIETESIGTLK